MEEIIAELGLDQPDPLARDTDSAALGAHPVRWRDLPDEDAPAAWAALRDWVEWVTARYNVPTSLIPPCWWRHAALVEELAALHTAWQASFHPTDAGYGPVGWHERWSIASSRLRAAYSGSCSSGHRDTPPRTWAGVTDENEWEAFTRTRHSA